MKNFETVVIEMYPEIKYDSDKLTVVQAQRAATTYALPLVEENKKIKQAIEDLPIYGEGYLKAQDVFDILNKHGKEKGV